MLRRTALALSPLLLVGVLATSFLPASAPAPDRWVQATLAEMTLSEQVAQLFAVQAYGYYASADDPAYLRLRDFVERLGVGGVIFFQGDPYGQVMLANDLQRRAKLPLLISQDMEWGAGMRVARTTTLPWTMAIGATRDPALAYAAGYLTAREARALGTHQIYAPVADVNNNPRNPVINVRSFGEEPGLVGAMVGAFVEGAQDGGVLATVKHFPGHGDTDTDSHYDLPTLPFTRARLDSLELVPFRAAIDAGVESVMTGHLALPALEPDPRVPATLSQPISEALLRGDLGFNGLIVTDAMQMRGVTKHFAPGEAAIRALEAGADMILMSADLDAAHTAVLEAVASGRLARARIQTAAGRILHAKLRLGLPKQRLVAPESLPEVVRTAAHEAVAEALARRSLTLLRNENDLLPLQRPERLFVYTLKDNDRPETGRAFAAALRTAQPATQSFDLALDLRTTDETYENALQAAAHAEVLVVALHAYVRLGGGQRALQRHFAFLEQLIATGKPVILIAFGNPYLIAELAQQPAAYLVAYSGSEASQRMAASALFGQVALGGKLPITIPDHYAYGAGLTLPQSAPRRDRPEAAGLATASLARVDSVLRAAIADRAFPGAAVAIGRGNVIAKLAGYGYHTYEARTTVTPQSVFDLASLTKVVATTTAAMQLYEAGRLDLDAPVARYLPGFEQNGKAAVTVRHLLTHTAGFLPFIPFYQRGVTTRQAVIDSTYAQPLVTPPGAAMRYSDFSMITLMLVIEAITGQDFDAYTRTHIFAPLGMHDTGFRGTGTPDSTVVPTEVDDYFRNRLVQGEVHDENAWLLGGTSGHAGLFSSADDLARFATMLVNGGRAGTQQFLKPETIRLFTTRVDPTGEHTRALGWDTRSLEGYSSAGQHFGPRSFGHTGFTGTSMWIDPDAKLYAILLTNRVYPTRANRKISAIRPLVADFAYEALLGPEGPPLPRRER